MSKRRRPRRIWTDDEKRMICRQARLPGVSVSQVARRYDVNANLVFNWLRDARFAPEGVEPPIEELAGAPDAATSFEAPDAGKSASPAFLPVELIAEPGVAPDAASVPGATPEPAVGTLEIALAGGHRLRIVGAYDPEALARLVRALSEPGA